MLRSSLLCLLCCYGLFLVAQPHFQEVDGLVIMEAESATVPPLWATVQTPAGFTGTALLRYDGSNNFNSPGNARYDFRVRITRTGTYRFQWRSRITRGDSNTEHNDSWLRFPDATEVFAERGGDVVYPHGSGRTPTPEGSGSDNWLKIYQNRLNDWSWNTTTSDNDPHDIFVVFAAPGDYTVQVSGRSNGHGIDRLVLYHADVPTARALDVTLPESPRVTVSTAGVEALPVRCWPNPAVDTLYVDLPAVPNGPVSIFSAEGRLVATVTVGAGSAVSVPVADLPGGVYTLRVPAGGKWYGGRFIVGTASGR